MGALAPEARNRRFRFRQGREDAPHASAFAGRGACTLATGVRVSRQAPPSRQLPNMHLRGRRLSCTKLSLNLLHTLPRPDQPSSLRLRHGGIEQQPGGPSPGSDTGSGRLGNELRHTHHKVRTGG